MDAIFMLVNVPTVHQTDIEGLRTFWVDTPPPLTASLVFRVGAWDESIRIRGITHLVEHLALFNQREAKHGYNGSVHGDRAVFWASGKPDDVTTFLGGLAADLRKLPVERIDTEAGVLQAEATQRRGGSLTMILRGLFGPNGPGLIDIEEVGLRWLGGGSAQAWADRYFTTANAVLLLDGEPPGDLQIDLPDGQPMPYQLPGPELGLRPNRIEQLASQKAGIGYGSLVNRSTDANAAVTLAAKHLTDRVRHELGLAYTVYATYMPLDRETAFAYMGADADEQQATKMGSSFMFALKDLARTGPSQDQVDWVRRPPPEPGEYDEAALARSELHRIGSGTLMGDEEFTLDELLEMQNQMSCESLKAAMGEMLDGALVVAPDGTSGLLPRTKRHHSPVDGTQFRTTRKHRNKVFDELVVGAEGISGRTEGRWVTLVWDDVVEAQLESGHWWIYARSGAYMDIAVGRWKHGDRLTQELNRLIPQGAFIPKTRSAADADETTI